MQDWVTDTDGTGLALDIGGSKVERIGITNVNIKIARREIESGANAQCHVETAGGVALERRDTNGRVGVARGVVKERVGADGSVNVAFGVAKERFVTGGRVGEAAGVAKERMETDARVVRAVVG